MFKWVCLTIAVVFSIAILYLVYDLKRDVTKSLAGAQLAVADANRAVATVNERLPEILSEVKEGTETLSDLAEDVELIKSVAGIRNETTDRGLRGLATYADDLQKLLASEAGDREAMILIEAIVGSDLKEVESVEEFLVGLNKEMVAIILPFAKSKEEILYRATHSSPPRRKPFYVQFPTGEPVKLIDFIRQRHPESADLPDFH